MAEHILLRNIPESLDEALNTLKEQKRFKSKNATIQWILMQYFYHHQYYFVRSELSETSELLAQAIERNTTILEMIREEIRKE